LAPTFDPSTRGAASDTRGALSAYNRWYAEPTQANLENARMLFLTTAALQLYHSGISDGDAQKLYAEAKLAPRDAARFAAVTDAIKRAAIKYETSCVVAFSTRIAGAVINYQTFGERLRSEKPHSMPSVTNCQARLPIGSYFIWSVRGGKATSDMDREIPIINETESVQLEEQP
jgi:hypothetical protein